MRNYQTGYVLAKETGDNTNVWELYVGKAGALGQFSFLLSLADNTFTITDTRNGVEFKYEPKLLGGDGVSAAAKIATDSVNQIVKRFLCEKTKKEAIAKPKKAAVAKKEKKIDAELMPVAKRAHDQIVDTRPVCTFDEIPEPAFGIDTVTVGNLECQYTTVNRGKMTQVIVSTKEGKKLTTLIGPVATDTDIMNSAVELANRFYISQ